MVGSQDNLLTYGCIQIRLSNHTITPQETFYKFNNAHGYSYRNRDKSKTLYEYGILSDSEKCNIYYE